MWERRICIYGTLRVFNNFPFKSTHFKVCTPLNILPFLFKYSAVVGDGGVKYIFDLGIDRVLIWEELI